MRSSHVKRSSVFAFAALVMCAGCATFAPQPRAAYPMPDAGALIRDVVAAEAQFDSAAIHGNAAAMAAMFTDDAILVVASDTLRGHDAIHQVLEQIRLSSDSARIRFTPRTRDVCLDGVIEYGQQVDVTLYRVAAEDRKLSFRYAIRWLAYGRQGVRATALVITRPQEVWTARFRDCVLASTVGFDRHRIAVSAMIPGPMNSWSTLGSLESTMRSRGFGGAAPGYIKSSSQRTWWYGFGLRAGLWDPFSAEIVVGLQPRKGTIEGYRASDSTVVNLSYTGGFAWAALNYEWRKRLRVGLGPYVVRTSWTINERYLAWVIGKNTWTDQGVGLLAEAAYTYPISRYVFAEAQAHARLLGTMQTLATRSFAPAQVTLGGFGLTLGGGLAF